MNNWYKTISEKYGESRGFKIDKEKITVKNPGEPVHGVKLYSQSEEGKKMLDEFKKKAKPVEGTKAKDDKPDSAFDSDEAASDV